MIMSNIGMYNVDICLHLFLCSSYTKILRLFTYIVVRKGFIFESKFFKGCVGNE